MRSIRLFLKALLITLALVVIVIFSTAVYQTNVYSYSDYLMYKEICEYPCGDEFWREEYKGGDDLEALIIKSPPYRIVRMDRYVWVQYAKRTVGATSIVSHSLVVISKDGAIVYVVVSGDRFSRVFVQMTQQDSIEFDTEWNRHFGR